MNVITTSFSPTQMILAWTLLGLLTGWLLIFTVLALGAFVMKKDDWEEIFRPSRPVPAIHATPMEEEHRQYVGAASGTIHREDDHTKQSWDSVTTPIRKTPQ